MARILSTNTGHPGGALSVDGGFIQAKSSTPDVLTIQGASAQAGDLFNVSTYKASSTDSSGEVLSISATGAVTWACPQSFTGGIKYGSVAVAFSTDDDYALLSSNSGKLHIVPAAASAASINLPTHAAGLYYKLLYKAYTAKIGVVASPGSIVSGAGTVGASVAAATGSDMVGGTAMEFFSDGTNWFMSYSPPKLEAAEGLAVANS